MSDIHIYVLNGPAGVGKDTFVSLVDNYLRNLNGSKAVSLSSVGGIKFIASQYFGYKESVKSDKDRKFLAELKFLTDDYCNYSFKYIEEEIQKMEEINKNKVYPPISVVFIMCREPDNIMKYCDKYNAKSVFIDSTREIHQVNNNAADANVRNFDYDITIHNDKDLANLTKIAESFVKYELYNVGKATIGNYH